ncbi:sensor domain-containing diguanylate cyclase [Altererythrobacter sp. CAU 1778]
MLSGLDFKPLRPAWALVFALLYGALAFASLEYTQNQAGIAHVWPSSGIAVAGLLLLQGRGRLLLIAGIALASALSNYTYGASPAKALGFTLANIIEALVVARVACSGDLRCLSFDRPAWVARFCLGALAGSLSSGLVALVFAGSDAGVGFFVSWVVTVLLGILLVGPAMIYSVRGLRRWMMQTRRRNGRRLAQGVVVVLCAAVAGYATFAQSDYPLLFLPFAVVSVTVFLLGFEGALLSVAVIGVIGSYYSVQGEGPVAYVEQPVDRALFFQFYLMTLLISSFPGAAILADRNRRAAELRNSRDLLQTAAEISNMGHWRYVIATETIEWSRQTYTICGYLPGRAVTLHNAIEAYHPEDRTRVSAIVSEAIQNQTGFEFEARVVHPDGTVRVVASRGEVEMEDDRVAAIFGVLIDITERAELLDNLQHARKEAEARAHSAAVAADTDALTGAANRRKAMRFLDATIADAEAGADRFAVILLDADHFKAINDTCGHVVGDLVLKEIAIACDRCLRPTDLFARIGGEEFLAVLPGADRHYATMIAERLRQAVTQISLTECGVDEISISLGVTVYQPGADATYLLQSADTALYDAKNSGRNRYAVAA